MRVGGSLDRASVLNLEDDMREEIDRHGARLVLDLSQTVFIDAAAIHLMETLTAHAAAAGGKLIIVLTSPRAYRLLEITPPREELSVVGSAEEAMAAWPDPGPEEAE